MKIEIDALSRLEPLLAPTEGGLFALSDVIFVRELKLETHIGAYEEERQRAQTLEFDLEIGTARSRACVSDHLTDTIDYAEVVDAMRTLLAASRFHLLEALAERVAELVLEQFGAMWVCVSVAKTGIVPGAKFVGVTIRRARQPASRSSGAETGRRGVLLTAVAAPGRNHDE